MSIAVTTTDPTNTGVSTTSSSSLTGSNAADLQSSFLTLLVAQLKNQDPTNPMENNELTSQLAQISTVSGIEKLNTTLGSISGQIDNSQSLQASNLIGHGVMIPGTTVLAGTGSEEGAVTTTTPFGVELQQAADKVTATITDKNGAVVRTIDIGELTAGVHSFTWDGTLTDGSNAADLQSSFLTLLVAQLKNQDPTNPMENNELTSQLAQISTVSGIEKLNTTLGSISGQIDNSQSLQASNLIGHGVMIPGTTVLAGTGSEEGAVTTTTPFGVELQQAADKVTATITDKNGAVVRTIDIGELTAGVHSFTWDGTLTDGSTAPNGSYNVAISASNGGTQLVAQPLQFALVQGVIRGNNGNTLDLGTYGTTTLDEVRQII